MEINLNLLRQEILTDPENLGYTNFLSIRNDIGIADLMNAAREGQSYLVPKGRMTKDQFIEATSVIIFNLMVLENQGSANASFWLKVFDRLVANSDTINSLDPNVDNLLSQMVADNLITPDEKNLILLRQGSRAEVLFNNYVTIDQISASLNEVN